MSQRRTLLLNAAHNLSVRSYILNPKPQLELFNEGPNFQLVRPGCFVLSVQVPVGVCDGVWVQEAVNRPVWGPLPGCCPQVNLAINYHMGHVHTLWAVTKCWVQKHSNGVQCSSIPIWNHPDHTPLLYICAQKHINIFLKLEIFLKLLRAAIIRQSQNWLVSSHNAETWK